MDDEKFKKLKIFYEDALELKDTPDDIRRLARALPGLYQMTIGFFSEQASVVGLLKVQKDKLYSGYFNKYKHEASRSYSTKEIDILIQKEDAMVEINREINKQKMFADYFEHTISNIKASGFNIKNYIDIKKFYQGDSY